MNFSIVKTKVFRVLTTMLFSVFFVSSINAQSGTTGVSGSVTDQNGAAVPGATVNLTNPATGFSRSGTTTDDGKFSFPAIPPATYRIEIKAANFKTLVSTNVQALVDSTDSIVFVVISTTAETSSIRRTRVSETISCRSRSRSCRPICEGSPIF